MKRDKRKVIPWSDGARRMVDDLVQLMAEIRVNSIRFIENLLTWEHRSLILATLTCIPSTVIRSPSPICWANRRSLDPGPPLPLL
jgi:hypothetical protein